MTVRKTISLNIDDLRKVLSDYFGVDYLRSEIHVDKNKIILEAWEDYDGPERLKEQQPEEEKHLGEADLDRPPSVEELRQSS